MRDTLMSLLAAVCVWGSGVGVAAVSRSLVEVIRRLRALVPHQYAVSASSYALDEICHVMICKQFVFV